MKKKRIHFPLWLFYYKYYNYDKEDNLLNHIEKQYKINSNKTKQYFATIVNSHDHYNTRTPIYDELAKYGDIKSPKILEQNINHVINNSNQYKEGRVFNKTAHSQLRKYYNDLINNLTSLIKI